MKFNQRLVQLMLLSLAVSASCAEIVPTCSQAAACKVTICPGKCFAPVCANFNMGFKILEIPSVNYTTMTPSSFCFRTNGSGTSNISCPLSSTLLSGLLSNTTSCFNQSALSCQICNNDSLRGLGEACLTERQLEFYYVCESRATPSTNSAATTSKLAALPTTDCPLGTVRQIRPSTSVDGDANSCVPISTFIGENCSRLALAADNIYQTDSGSCALVPTSVQDLQAATCVQASVCSQLLSKFTGAQDFSRLQDVSDFAQFLSDKLSPFSGNGALKFEPLTANASIQGLLKAVSDISTKGLGGSAASTASAKDSASLRQAAASVISAMDNLGGQLQRVSQTTDAVVKYGNIAIDYRRLSNNFLFCPPTPDMNIKLIYSGPKRLDDVTVVTASLNLPNLTQWLLPQPGQFLVSRVVQVSLFTPDSGKLQSGGSVLFLVPHMDGVLVQRTRRSCVFVDLDGALSDRGCTVAPELSNASYTACVCTHLTSFAVVSSPDETWLPVETHQLVTRHSLALKVIKYLFLCISILSLLLTNLAYFGLRLRTPNAGQAVTLPRVHRATCGTLMLAQIIFLIGFDRIEFGPVPCQVLSGITLYIFLAVFAWILCVSVLHGISVLMVRLSTDSTFAKVKFWHYCVMCYLTPAVITAVVVGVRSEQLYQTQADPTSSGTLKRPAICWLSVDYGTHLSFLIPMYIVCVVYLSLFIVGMAKTCRRDLAYAQAHAQGGAVGKYVCTQILSAVSLVNVLGISWAIGVTFYGEMELVLSAHYLFLMLNGLQGFLIFVTQALMQKPIQDGWESLLLKSRRTPDCLRAWLESRRAAARATVVGGFLSETSGGSNQLDSGGKLQLATADFSDRRYKSPELSSTTSQKAGMDEHENEHAHEHEHELL